MNVGATQNHSCMLHAEFTRGSDIFLLSGVKINTSRGLRDSK